MNAIEKKRGEKSKVEPYGSGDWSVLIGQEGAMMGIGAGTRGAIGIGPRGAIGTPRKGSMAAGTSVRIGPPPIAGFEAAASNGFIIAFTMGFFIGLFIGCIALEIAWPIGYFLLSELALDLSEFFSRATSFPAFAAFPAFSI